MAEHRHLPSVASDRHMTGHWCYSGIPEARYLGALRPGAPVTWYVTGPPCDLRPAAPPGIPTEFQTSIKGPPHDMSPGTSSKRRKPTQTKSEKFSPRRRENRKPEDGKTGETGNKPENPENPENKDETEQEQGEIRESDVMVIGLRYNIPLIPTPALSQPKIVLKSMYFKLTNTLSLTILFLFQLKITLSRIFSTSPHLS